MSKRVILFNGPPRSGKDTAGLAMQSYVPDDWAKIKFSDPLKDGVHATYGLDVSTDHYEDCKDIPNDDFLGMTPRAAYIYHSEKYLKPLHGKDVYGRLAANRMKRTSKPIVLVPDSGFIEEAGPVIGAFGTDNVLLIRIHKDGCDFSKDSRSYLDLPGVFTLDVTNVHGQIGHYRRSIHNAYETWLQS